MPLFITRWRERERARGTWMRTRPRLLGFFRAFSLVLRVLVVQVLVRVLVQVRVRVVQVRVQT